jgi:hypothetical protein
MGDDPPAGLFLRESKDRITGTPEFERTRLLKILTFEKQLSTEHSVKRRAGQDRSPMDIRLDPSRRRFDLSQSWSVRHPEVPLGRKVST